MKTFLFWLCFLAAAPGPEERARQALDLLLAGDAGRLHALFDDTMKKALSREALAQQIIPQIRGLGEVRKVGEPGVQKLSGYTVVVIPVQFASASIHFQATLDADGAVSGMFFRPAGPAKVEWKRPAYSKPEAFRERDVWVGEGEWKLPGTLAVPVGKGPFPGVVLVHGSGPNDRDETVGQHIVFRDLAEGLASRGVAVIRYDKRTLVHAAKLSTGKFTLHEETVEDAVHAARLLRRQPEVDPKRVFVIGHSLGGFAAPRIARADGQLAGLVMMAANTRPLEELILEQTEYLASLAPEGKRESAQLEQMRAAVAEMKRIRAGESPAKSVLGLPPDYLADLARYDPAAEARSLRVPMLILQGERDYQVTMRDFEGWKRALAERKDVTFKSYPALNHLFSAGGGKSTPAEYQKPGNVAEEVVADIADWIAARR